MIMIKAVLFDAGETLIRVRGSVGEVYARVASDHGVRVESAELEARFRRAFGAAPPLCFPMATGASAEQLEYGWWRDRVSDVFEGLRFADFDAFFRELFGYFARPQSWEVFADVEPTLQALHQRGLRLAVVSNFDGRLFPVCDGLGLTRYFDTIIVSGRAGAAKPDPRIFAAALARLGCEPSATLHVGDSQHDDVDGAHAAGLQALRIDRTAADCASGTIRSLGEVLQVEGLRR